MSSVRGLAPKRFLQRFFGDGNEIDLQSPPTWARALQYWVQRVEKGKDRILLPRKENGRVTWYALTDSGRNARTFREELLAAVGPSYTDFFGAEATLDRSDPVEAAILDFTGPHAFKLSLVDPELTDACRRALRRMLDLHDGRPPSRVRAPRVPGLILRDFEFALQQRDRELADAAMEELRSGGYLDGQNLRFLNIRRKEAFHEWDAIRDEVEEETILELRRPVRITQALLRAIYRVDLLRFEEGVRASEAVVYFEQQLFGSIRALLNTRRGMTAPEISKLFMLKAAATRDPRLRDSLLEGSSVRGADKVYLQALADLVRSPELEEGRKVLRDEAVVAYMSGDTDRAFELLVMGGGGEWRMRLLLRCALELGTLRVAEIALNVIKGSSPAERDTLQNDSTLARQLKELKDRYTAPSASVPNGWLDWVKMVSIADVLATLEHDEGRAKLMATRAGLPVQYLPKFETAAVFWNDVVDQAIRGRFRLSELVLRASKEFPYNIELAYLASRLEESQESQSTP